MKAVYPVKVTWKDSKSHGHWHHASHIPSAAPSEVVSYGLRLEWDTEKLTLGQSFCEDTDQIGNVLVIPRSAVIKVEKLVAKKR